MCVGDGLNFVSIPMVTFSDEREASPWRPAAEWREGETGSSSPPPPQIKGPDLDTHTYNIHPKKHT